MKDIKVNIHSIVDVITNSSTEIFIGVHSKSIDMIKEVINDILELSNSTKTVDDLFEFELLSYDIDCDIDCWWDEYKYENKNIKKIDRKKISKEEENNLRNKFCPNCESHPSSIIIKSKSNNKSINVSKFKNNFKNIFKAIEVPC